MSLEVARSSGLLVGALNEYRGGFRVSELRLRSTEYFCIRGEINSLLETEGYPSRSVQESAASIDSTAPRTTPAKHYKAAEPAMTPP